MNLLKAIFAAYSATAEQINRFSQINKTAPMRNTRQLIKYSYKHVLNVVTQSNIQTFPDRNHCKTSHVSLSINSSFPSSHNKSLV